MAGEHLHPTPPVPVTRLASPPLTSVSVSSPFVRAVPCVNV